MSISPAWPQCLARSSGDTLLNSAALPRGPGLVASWDPGRVSFERRQNVFASTGSRRVAAGALPHGSRR